MNELNNLRLSLARVAQELGIKSPLITDGDGKPKTFESLQQAVELGRGWNGLAAQCVEQVQHMHAAKEITKGEIETLAITLKGTFGYLEAWQCHLSDNARDKAAKDVGDVLDRSRLVAAPYPI